MCCARPRELALAALLVSLHQLAEAAVPVTVGWVIDLAVVSRDSGALLRWLAVVVAVFLVLASSAFVGYWLAARTERMAAHRVRMDVAERVLHPAGGAVAGGEEPGGVDVHLSVRVERIDVPLDAVVVVELPVRDQHHRLRLSV